MTRSFTRGFRGRGAERDARLPPGQYDAGRSWPVLSAEPTPKLDTATWTFNVEGLVARPTTWTWDEIHALPPCSYDGAIHCVTTWSKFDMRWDGVSVDTLLDVASRCRRRRTLSRTPIRATRRTCSSPTSPVKAWIAWSVDGEPLSAAHGGPARLLVPHLYFWKSAKWVAGLRVLDHDESGFWEVRGYHDRGDPWLEQRYQGD